MPFDKYELEPCELTQHVLTLRRTLNPNICFQCFIQNSGPQEGPGRPFGYLKPSSTGQKVNLVVLPYEVSPKFVNRDASVNFSCSLCYSRMMYSPHPLETATRLMAHAVRK